jgi:hypothetical protein
LSDEAATHCVGCGYTFSEPEDVVPLSRPAEEPAPRRQTAAHIAAHHGDGKNEERAALERELAKVEEEGLFTIGVIGFATSGKTFFVQRLKSYMRRKGGYEPDPPPAQDEIHIQGTRNIEIHRFDVRDHDDDRFRAVDQGVAPEQPEPFYMIDIPGERCAAAMESALRGEAAEQLIKVLKLSHALIIVVPADEVFAPVVTRQQRMEIRLLKNRQEDLHKEAGAREGAGNNSKLKKELARIAKEISAKEQPVNVEERLTALLDNVAIISAIASELVDESGQRISLQRYQMLDDAERAAIFTGERRGPAPLTFVAMTKADLLIGRPQEEVKRLFPQIEAPEFLDCAPADAFKLHRPDLYRQIARSFAWHKFDFVTAFDAQPKDDLRIYYWLDFYGVAAVVDWIHWARGYLTRTGRIRSGAPRRFERPRAFWDRTEGVITRTLGRWRAEGATHQPEEMGLDPAGYSRRRDSLRNRFRAWRSTAIEALMRERSGWALALAAGSTVAVVLASLWTLGVFSSGERPGFRFPLEPVYADELRQMQEDEALFATGVEAAGLRRWENVPSDGGWFSFDARNPARGPLERAIRLIPASAGEEALDPQRAEEAVEALGSSAAGDHSQIRAANSYHQGLLLYMSGNYPAAAAAFRTADEAIQRVLENPPVGGRFNATASRIPVVQLAILLGEGTAHLRAGKPEAAIVPLRAAKSLARDEAGRMADPTSVGEFWYTAATRDAAPMLRVPTADIWTNYLAALIRLHTAAASTDKPIEEAVLRRELGFAVRESRDRLEEAQENPQLATNLMIAAAHSGQLRDVNVVDSGVAETSSAVAAEVRRIIEPNEAAGLGSESYWRSVRDLRGVLSPTPGTTAQGSAQQVDSIVKGAGPENEGRLRGWLAEVIERKYDSSSGPVRRELTRNYGTYYRGVDLWRAYDGSSPFGLALGIPLAIILLLGLAVTAFAYRRVRKIYLRLYEPRHRSDRLSTEDE